MTAMVKAIIFDWHGVLDETKLELLIEKLSELTQLDKEEIRNRMHKYERSWVTGTEAPEVFWKEIKQIFHLTNENINEAKSMLMTVKEYEPLWKLLPDLKTKYKLAILSDCPLDKVEVIRTKADLSFFQEINFSAEKHLLKDSEEFFLSILRDLDLKAQECLYVDDKEKHTNTAKSLGFQVCLFGKIEDLEVSLSK